MRREAIGNGRVQGKVKVRQLEHTFVTLVVVNAAAVAEPLVATV